eukprot:SAG31_NODE_4148_length_3529_cov_3.182216_3_plen_38_part_01
MNASYVDIGMHSDMLATQLRDYGVTAGCVVAVSNERSV